MKWYLGVLKKYATTSGRARRKEYWMFFLVNIIIGFAVGFIFARIGRATGHPVIAQLGDLYALAVLILGVAVGVRRMHDVDRSGWWLVVPFVNLGFACTRGTRGENQFGPDPKAPSQSEGGVATRKGPTSLTVAGWAIVVLNLSGALTMLSSLLNPVSAQLLANFLFPVWATLTFGLVSNLISAAIGIAVLEGRAWSRVAYVVIFLLAIAFMFLNAPSWTYVTMLPAIVIFGVIVYLLYRRPATEYFRQVDA
jgi:uncharacterized membrane protein YhaH (DUF805 family)